MRTNLGILVCLAALAASVAAQSPATAKEPAKASLEGSVLKGIVVAIENDFALVDVGLKSEGRVQLKEFGQPGQKNGGKRCQSSLEHTSISIGY